MIATATGGALAGRPPRGAAAALLVAALACGAPAGDAAQSRGGPPGGPDTFTEIPFEVHDRHVYVPVEVRGPAGSRRVWMILDTGAGRVAVDAALARALGAGIEWTGEVRGAGAAPIRTGRARDLSVALGGIVLAEDGAATLPLDSVLSPFTGRPEPGVVGGSLFGDRIVELDFEARRVLVRDRARWSAPDGLVVPIEIESGRPVTDLSVTLPGRGPVTARALVDLGAKGAALFTSRFEARTGALATLPPTVETSYGAGVGGETRFRLTRVPALAAGAAVIEDPVVGFADRGMLPGRYDALLGFEFLRRHRVAFDYAGGRMILSPTAAVDEPDGFDASGMFVVAPEAHGVPGAALEPRHRRIEVLRLVPGGPAARAGVRAGDRVEAVSIDGVPIDLSVASLRESFREDAGATAALILRRAGELLEVAFRLEPIV